MIDSSTRTSSTKLTDGGDAHGTQTMLLDQPPVKTTDRLDPKVKQSQYGSVQAMRALSVIGVVLFHVAMRHRQDISDVSAALVYPLSLFGHCGVDLFFLISGFIIATVNWQNFAKPSKIFDYALKRLIRIYPIYWLTGAFILIFGFAPGIGTKALVGALLLLPHYASSINQVAWTLSYEVIFYITFAFFLFCPRRYLPVCLGVWFCLIAFAQRFPGPHNGFATLQNFLRPLNLEFVLGVSIALLIHNNRLFKRPRLLILLGVLGIAMAAAWKHFGQNPYPEFDGNVRALIFGLPSAFILYGFITLEILERSIYSKLILLIGDASYSIYLVHFVLVQVLMLNPIARSFKDPFTFLLWEAFVVVLVVIAGVLTHLKLEKPTMNALKVRLLR
jgi:peptidoglycan/LPS O-acetylase OafA/YrhL